MEMLTFGHGGTPLLVFPSSMGRYYEWEDFEMIKALAPQIEGGFNTCGDLQYPELPRFHQFPKRTACQGEG